MVSIPANGTSDMPKRDMPEWDGFGNKYQWILEQAKRLREERNGHIDRPSRIPDLRLYISGRLVDLPKVALPSRASTANHVRMVQEKVVCLGPKARSAHPVQPETSPEKAE